MIPELEDGHTEEEAQYAVRSAFCYVDEFADFEA
jgi:hypothetical protein